MQRIKGAKRHCPVLVIELDLDMSRELNTANSLKYKGTTFTCCQVICVAKYQYKHPNI